MYNLRPSISNFDITKIKLWCPLTSGSDDDKGQNKLTPAYSNYSTMSPGPFGETSVPRFTGTSQYISFPWSSDWGLFDKSIPLFTFDLWAYHDTKNDNDAYLSQTGSGKHWDLKNNAGQNEGILVHIEPPTAFQMDEGTNAVTTGVWHHIMIVRIGNIMGIYRDGIQKTYGDISALASYIDTNPLVIGTETEYISAAFDGGICHVRCHHDNIFDANPNIGKTDTIKVPTAGAQWRSY